MCTQKSGRKLSSQFSISYIPMLFALHPNMLYQTEASGSNTKEEIWSSEENCLPLPLSCVRSPATVICHGLSARKSLYKALDPYEAIQVWSAATRCSPCIPDTQAYQRNRLTNKYTRDTEDISLLSRCRLLYRVFLGNCGILYIMTLSKWEIMLHPFKRLGTLPCFSQRI